MKIFLDDDPMRDSWVDDTWTIVRTAEACQQALVDNLGEVEILSLDHDLGDDEPTGYDLLRNLEWFLATGDRRTRRWKKFLPQKFEIHSANPVGRKNMQAAIDSIERMRNGS